MTPTAASPAAPRRFMGMEFVFPGSFFVSVYLCISFLSNKTDRERGRGFSVFLSFLCQSVMSSFFVNHAGHVFFYCDSFLFCFCRQFPEFFAGERDGDGVIFCCHDRIFDAGHYECMGSGAPAFLMHRFCRQYSLRQAPRHPVPPPVFLRQKTPDLRNNRFKPHSFKYMFPKSRK